MHTLSRTLSLILIDDERRVRNHLRRTLEDCGGVDIVGEAASLEDARRILAAHPDVDGIFLDIQLAGGTGFDLVQYIADMRRVVFVTAFDQYAIRAFEVNALDYVMKPVSQERLEQSLHRLRLYMAQRLRGQTDEQKEEQKEEQVNIFNDQSLSTAQTSLLTAEDQILLKFGTKNRFVRVQDILVVRSADNYTEIHIHDGGMALMRKTLEEWAESLPTDYFVRIHRSTLVNLEAIQEIVQDDGGRIAVHLQTWTEVLPVSRGYAPHLRELFRS
jgi:two-component system, LytTR family, response regulator